MGSLEKRLAALEGQLIGQPTVDEYLDASNREGVRGLQALAERLEKYGFDGGYLFTEVDRRMLAEDTPEQQAKDRELINAWRRAQGIDAETEAEGAKEKLLAMLETRS